MSMPANPPQEEKKEEVKADAGEAQDAAKGGIEEEKKD